MHAASCTASEAIPLRKKLSASTPTAPLEKTQQPKKVKARTHASKYITI